MFSSAALKTHNIEAHYINQLKNRWIPNTQYCNICEKYFSSFQTMKNHYKTIHLNIKENQHCNLCPKKFTSEKALEFHKNFIHSIKNVPKMSNNSINLKKENSNAATKIKKERQFEIVNIIFRCQKCTFSTSYDGEMIRHYESEHVRLSIDPKTFR